MIALSRSQTILDLLALGCPPLPVAPIQDPRLPYCHHQSYVVERFRGADARNPEIQGEYCRISFTKVGESQAPIKGDYCRLDEKLTPIAKFTGKNPSYLDRDGKPRTLNHREFQKRLPTQAELDKWFANPANGVGTLGGHNGVDWLDFDAKNYTNQEACDLDVQAILERVGATWVEQTGSGGWRVAVKPEQQPDFTNFTTDPSGDGHIGEALWEGRFTVLAPTIHPNGNPYRRISAGEPAAVKSLESIGIYPTKDEVANTQRKARRRGSGIQSVVSDPAANPWDMRHFADYLEGSHIDGDYYECRCPVHQGNSDTSLNIHRHTGAFWCWSGCDNSQIFKRAKEIAIGAGYKPNVEAREAQRRRDGKITFERDPAKEQERESRDRLRLIDLGEPKNYQEQTQQIQAELSGMRITPTISESGRYIQPGGLVLPEQSGIVLIDATMGAGKTATAIKGLVEQHRTRFPQAFRMLGVPRNLLGYQSGEVLGLPHHKRLKGGVINEVTLCLESIFKVAPSHLPSMPPLIILDEASQTFKQILEGQTCQDNQVGILNRLKEIFQWVKEQGGWIVLSEDGLTNCEVDFVQELSGLQVVESLKFVKELDQTRDYSIFTNPSLTWSELESQMFSGENIIACTDSAKWARETERWAISHCGLHPDSVKVIDSKSSEEPWVKQFAANPDAWISANKPRLLIYTPSINSGVSITDSDQHFSAMAMHLVHLEAREAKQLPDRLRSDVPRFGYVKERGAATDDQFSSCRPEVLIRNLYRNQAGIEKITQFSQYLLEKNPCDRDGNPLDLLGVMADLQKSQNDPSSDYGFWLRHWARYRAREAYSKLTLRGNLIAIWEQQGHEVELLKAESIKPLSQKRKEIRAELDTELAEKFALTDATKLSLEQAREILNNLGSTQEERIAAWKRLTEDKLPGCNLDDPLFVLKALIQDNGRMLKATERLWMALNPEATKMIDRWQWAGAFTRAAKAEEIVWIPRLSTRSGQAKLISESPLHPFIRGEIEQWDNNTPKAIEVHEWAVLHARQIKRYLRLTISENHSPVQTVNKLLRHVGLEVIKSGWKGSRKDRVRQFRIENLQDADRDAILQALADRFLSRCEEKQESPPYSVIATRSDISPFASCDHTPQKDIGEDLEFIRQMWRDAAGNPSMLSEIRQMIPADQLRRAIA